MIKISNLTHRYGPETFLKFPDWEVKKGQHALILGSSGCGKTTLLHLISGLLSPTEGSVVIAGTHLEQLSTTELDHFRGKHIGFVFQKPHLVRSLNVMENVRLAAYLGQKKTTDSEIRSVLEELKIGSLAHRKVSEISQGQAQRVSIARAMINQPDLIIGDEPTASLDDEACQAVLDLLIKEAEACDATLVIATHDQRVKSEFSNQLKL